MSLLEVIVYSAGAAPLLTVLVGFFKVVGGVIEFLSGDCK